MTVLAKECPPDKTMPPWAERWPRQSTAPSGGSACAAVSPGWPRSARCRASGMSSPWVRPPDPETRDGTKNIDPGVDHRPVALIGCGLTHITQPRRLLDGIAQRLGRVVAVLEVAARRAHSLQLGDKLHGRHRVLRLRVHRHRDADAPADPCRCSEHLARRRPFVVLVAERGATPALAPRLPPGARRRGGPSPRGPGRRPW
jgi:hypothetical protein